MISAILSLALAMTAASGTDTPPAKAALQQIDQLAVGLVHARANFAHGLAIVR